MYTTIGLIRGIIAGFWIAPLILLFGIFNPSKAEKIGLAYRDFVELLAEL